MNKLTQIKDYLLEVAFLALIVRTVVLGAGIGDALAIVAIVGSLAYGRWLNKSKVEALDEVNKKIEDLSTQIQSIRLEKSLRRQVNEPQAQSSPPKRIF